MALLTEQLPSLPSSAVNKRKWGAPPAGSVQREDEEGASSAEVEAPAAGPSKRSRVADEEEDEFAPGNDADYFVDEDEEGGRFFGGGLTDEQKRILEIMSHDESGGGEQQPGEQLAEIRRQLLQFEKAINKNQEMRVKFPTEPQRFIASEADLDAEIRALVVLTTNVAQYYPEFVKLGTAASLVALLTHENADIAGAAIQVLEELTDDDVLDGEAGAAGGERAMHALLDTLLANQVTELLVSNLSRFDDTLPPDDDPARLANYESDAQNVYHTLGVLENLVSLRAALAEEIIAQTQLLPWLLRRMQRDRFDQNKGYAGELLAILLQGSEANREALGRSGGVDALLSTLAPYRRHSPTDPEETEFMENTFDALCSALLLDANKPRFLESEGVELMVLILRSREAARLCALRVLDHALGGAHGAPQCERFVEALGLRSLFAVFMQADGRGRAAPGAADFEHVLGILASLLHNLGSESAPRLRVLSKFVEQNFAKVDRLLELRETTVARLRVVEREVAQERAATEGAEEEEEELFYLRRLESGLFTLQLVDYILAWLVMEDDGVKTHAEMLLRRSGLSFRDVARVLREYADNVGDATVAAGGEEMRTRDILQALLEYVEALP